MAESEPQEPTYSRDEIVSELKSYYKFLIDLYLPLEVHITPDFVDSFFLGKNDTVADLMRHIPYEVVLSLPNKYAHKEFFEIPEEAYLHKFPSHFAPDKEEWRRSATYTFQEFFTLAKDKFRSFRMIYQEEGVFKERYDREKCISRIEAYFKL
ncbi:hypothetical protein CTA2_8785 [Colletotrichum tanaceti]|uniref:Uncharacterized protein n=1 Tax=Colletotrichum tanaceti TaxID=1306861 RepID=A0A4U6XU71_9PEZI|nr:hypothetical protein CTA2_8785 [Colletotrichum tanaceti]TKW59451.1 hypothetical protein CTA1_11470 [Colletotrichum tanaceti]